GRHVAFIRGLARADDQPRGRRHEFSRAVGVVELDDPPRALLPGPAGVELVPARLRIAQQRGPLEAGNGHVFPPDAVYGLEADAVAALEDADLVAAQAPGRVRRAHAAGQPERAVGVAAHRRRAGPPFRLVLVRLEDDVVWARKLAGNVPEGPGDGGPRYEFVWHGALPLRLALHRH